MKTIEVKLTFLEGILGTCPNDEDIYRNYIGSKSPDASTIAEELMDLTVDEVAERGMTVFPRDENGKPFIYDYQIKGFFKDACSMLRKISGTESSKIKAFKKEIDGLIFPNPRKIAIDGEVSVCQRPLRAQTPQGERVALAMSEEIAAGAQITFEVTCLQDSQIKLVKEWLDYGKLRGIGQWRNSGKGRFEWKELRVY